MRPDLIHEKARDVWDNVIRGHCDLSQRAHECLSECFFEKSVPRCKWHGSVHALIRRDLMAWADYTRTHAVLTKKGAIVAASAFYKLAEKGGAK